MGIFDFVYRKRPGKEGIPAFPGRDLDKLSRPGLVSNLRGLQF